MSTMCVCAQPPVPPGGAEVPAGAGSNGRAHTRPVVIVTPTHPLPSVDFLIVELRPVGAGPPAAIRFRTALKYLLRRHGLKASWPEPSRTLQPAAPAKATR